MKQLQLPKELRVALWIGKKIVYYLRIFGLAPFSVGTATPDVYLRHAYIKIFKYSKIGLIYNLALSISLTVFMAVIVYQDLRAHNFRSEDMVLQFIYAIQVIARAFSTSSILILWTLKQRSAICIMNHLLEVEIQIHGSGKKASGKRTIVFPTLHLIINVVIWITFWITEIIMNPYAGNYKVSLWTITTSHIIYFFIMEYVIAVSLIARGLEAINKNLLKSEESRCYVSRLLLVNDFSQASGSQLTNNQLAALQSLIRIREKLADVAEDVEDFFSFSILCCIVYTFVAVVYINYKFIANPNMSMFPLTGFVMWLSVHLYPVISLSAIVTETAKQRKLTALIVRKILIVPLKREIQSKLEQFSRQLLIGDFTFTSYGFFTLDFTLMSSIAGATMSYLVILLQAQAPTATSH